MSRQNAQHRAGKEKCPDCGVAIPAYPRYTPWCDQCNWNIQPDNVMPLSGWQQVLSQYLAYRLFNQVRRDIPHKRMTGTQTIALLLATSVYLLQIGLLAGAGWMGWGGGFGRTLLAILLSFLVIRTLSLRHDKLPSDVMVIDPAQFPELTNIVREVSRRLAIPMPQIMLSEQFTATFARIGRDRHSVLCVGIPLLAILTKGELISLIGHELSHDRDGAITRSPYIQNARIILENWNSSLAFFDSWTVHSNRLIVLCGSLLTVSTLLLRLPIGWGIQLLALLSTHDGKRAEFVADLYSLAVAGNRDAPQLLRKSYYRHLGALVEAYNNARPQQKYVAVQDRFAEIPHREKERVWRIAQMQQPRFKSSHPTVTERIALLENRRDVPPAFILDEEQFAKIQAELRSAPPLIHKHK